MSEDIKPGADSSIFTLHNSTYTLVHALHLAGVTPSAGLDHVTIMLDGTAFDIAWNAVSDLPDIYHVARQGRPIAFQVNGVMFRRRSTPSRQ